jgi:hypothetical protein
MFAHIHYTTQFLAAQEGIVPDFATILSFAAKMQRIGAARNCFV